MEISSISPGIRCISSLEFGHSIPQFPLQSTSSLHHSSFLQRPPLSSRQWRKYLSSTRSLADDPTTSSVNLASQFDDSADASLAVKFQYRKKATDLSAYLKGTSLFLIGMKSEMKTRVGKLIADELRYYYFDSDGVVEEVAGDDSSGKSFRERDADGFHASETEVLKQLSSLGRLVVNAGNGAVQSVTNLALLRHGISIWIDVPLDIIAKELIADAEQPTIQPTMSNISISDPFSEALNRLILLYEESKGGFATADVTISLQSVASNLAYDDFEQVTAEDMALEVLKQIEKLTRKKKMMEEAGRPF